jgi:hypothetical protein
MHKLLPVLMLAALFACEDAAPGHGAGQGAQASGVGDDGDGGAPDAGPAGVQPASSGRLDASGGELFLEGASLQVPAGALERAQELSIAVVQAPRPLPDGTLAASAVYAITPHGLSFAVPITVRLPFDGEVDDTLALQRLAGPEAATWQSAPTVGFARRRLRRARVRPLDRGHPGLRQLWKLPGRRSLQRCGRVRGAGRRRVERRWRARCGRDGRRRRGRGRARRRRPGRGGAGFRARRRYARELVTGWPGPGARLDVEDLDGDPDTRLGRIMLGQGVSHYAADGSLYVMGYQTISRYTPADGNFERVAGKPWPTPYGYADGDPSVSELGQPAGNLILGDQLYFADNPAYNIRRMDLLTHEVETFVGPTGSQGAGFVDGVGSGARFAFRSNSAFESSLTTDGNFLYVADSDNRCIRRVDLGVLPGGTAGEVITIAGSPPPTPEYGYADGIGTASRFYSPFTIAYEPTRNILIVGDGCNQRTRRIDLPADPRSPTYMDEVVVSTLTGDGQRAIVDGIGTAASHPNCSMRAGSLIVDDRFIVSTGGLIREVDIETAEVTTVIGPYPDNDDRAQVDGVGAAARLLGVGGTFAYDGSHVYFSDYWTLRRYDPLTYEVETLVGVPADWNLKADGARGDARLGGAAGFVRDTPASDSRLIMEGSAGLRRLELSSGTLTTITGPRAAEAGYADGIGEAARVSNWIGGAVQVGDEIYFSDSNNCAIRAITPDWQQPDNSVTRTLVGAPPPTADCSTLEGVGTDARVNRPGALVHHDGMLYVTGRGGHVVYALDPQTLQLSVLAGDGTDATLDGTGTAAQVSRPMSMALGHDGMLYLGGLGVPVIRRLDPVSGELVTVAGDYPGLEVGLVDGVGLEARIEGVLDIVASPDGRTLYVLDRQGVRTLDVDSLELSTLFAGDPLAFYPVSAAVPFETQLGFWQLDVLGPREFLVTQQTHGNVLRMTLP